jgi:hypothetical protein
MSTSIHSKVRAPISTSADRKGKSKSRDWRADNRSNRVKPTDRLRSFFKKNRGGDIKSTVKGVQLPTVLSTPLSEDDVSIASSFISLNQTYRFRLGGYASLASSAGAINSFVAADPSASGWNSPEWSSLTSLFSEFRLVSLSVTFTPLYYDGAVGSAPPAIIAGNLATAVAPGSYAALADNADAKMWNFLSDRSMHGYTHTIKATNLNFSQVTTPTVEPYAGAPGSIQFYVSGLPTTATWMYLLISGIYEFRSRV